MIRTVILKGRTDDIRTLTQNDVDDKLSINRGGRAFGGQLFDDLTHKQLLGKEASPRKLKARASILGNTGNSRVH